MQKSKPPAIDSFSKKESAKRMDAALKAALGMAPKPHKAPNTKAKKKRPSAKA